MRRLFASLRARAALAATLVVAVALVVAGVAVVAVLRGNLVDRAGLESEVAARTVAGSQPALNGRFGSLDLPEDESHLVQVVDSAGKVLAAGDELHGRGPVTNFSPAPKGTAPPHSSDDDDDDHDSTPARGKVGTDVDHRTLAVRVGDETQDYSFAAVQGTTYDGRTYTVYAGTSLKDEQATLDQVTRAMLIGLPCLLLVVAGVTWLATRKALRPVEGIRAEMAEITASGDLSRRVPQPDSHDEIARLAATTNETLTALERSVERQHRFVADASHELRSPIASLRTQLEVAVAHSELLDVEDVLQDVIRLQHLAADLLLLARLDAGERPKGARVDLAALVHEELAERAATDRITPDLAISGTPLDVHGNSGQLRRVLGNLLDNAERHARSTVGVELRAEGADVVLTVTDDGPGVPEADRERIFERFVRLDEARTRDDGGAGLGLAIARDVVQRHGGTLSVDQAPTGGAAFQARLPRAT
ncbi:sensor histidine kinase [Streptomyces palmae]|uniref:histidine kinase n=1 Tax=Streptomyces palmae TaxID=1701085 RepID=A0A4Z0HCX6_9ACTN|nr:HAMP domain-containing sensor histidine kinase [Streptomyces palmae]TGB14980.1 HAMP domain-containing histidine kinase [Streptomyces palmae]